MKKYGLLKYLPNSYYNDIFHIPYKDYLDRGIKIIFFDLDNTIADYETHSPDELVLDLFNKLKKNGFTLFILSNNHKKRVFNFGSALDSTSFHSLAKPFKNRINKYIHKYNINKDEVLWIGDQIVTDIALSNKLGILSILVDPINPKTEKWYTKINRFFERILVNRINKNYNDEFIELGLNKRWKK